jgi:hypothetical protein
MHNVTHKVTGDKLVIEIDLSKKALGEAHPSKSGKTLLIATSGGALAVPFPGKTISFSLNVMMKP